MIEVAGWAEEALVAGLLLHPDQCDAVARVVRPGDFGSPLCGELFGRLARGDGRAVELVEGLRRDGRLHADGYPVRELLGWLSDAPPRQALPAYARIVVEGAVCRRVVAAGRRVAQAAGEGPGLGLAVASRERGVLVGLVRRLRELPVPAASGGGLPVRRGARSASATRGRAALPPAEVSSGAEGPRAELAVVGSLLEAPPLVGRVGWLEPGDFADPLCRAAFARVRAAAGAGGRAEVAGLLAVLPRELLAAAGGAEAWQRELRAAVAVPAWVGFEGREVLEAAVRRRLEGVGSALVREATDGHGGGLGVASGAVARLGGLSEVRARLRDCWVTTTPAAPLTAPARGPGREPAPVVLLPAAGRVGR